MAAKCEPSTWKAKFRWQRGVKAAKEALVVLSIDAMMGVGLVIQVLTIPSQGRLGDSFSPCDGGHCVSPRAGAPCSKKGSASPDCALMNLDGSAVNSWLQQLEMVPHI